MTSPKSPISPEAVMVMAFTAVVAFVVGFMVCVSMFGSVKRDYVKAGVIIVDAAAYRIVPMENRP